MPFFGEISPDERWFASSKIFSKTITLWDIAQRKEIRTYPEMNGRPLAVQFSKDSSRLAARCSLGEVVIWDRESGEELSRFEDSASSLEDLLDPDPPRPYDVKPVASGA